MAHLYYCILRMKMAWEGRRRTRPAGDGAGAAARHCTVAGVHKPNGFVICMFIGGGRNLHSRISCERGRFVFVRRKQRVSIVPPAAERSVDSRKWYLWEPFRLSRPSSCFACCLTLEFRACSVYVGWQASKQMKPGKGSRSKNQQGM